MPRPQMAPRAAALFSCVCFAMPHLLLLAVGPAAASTRVPLPPWDLTDGPNGEMGLASRGLFAVELFSLDYWFVVWKVHYHIMPAVEQLELSAKLLPAAAVQLRLPATAVAGKDAAQKILTDHIQPLVESASFPTHQVQGGRAAKATALWAGRKQNPTSSRPNPQPFHTDCGSGTVADGGAAPLLQHALTGLGDPANQPAGASALADTLDCVAKQATAHADALLNHKYGSSHSITLHPDGWAGLMKAFVTNYEWIEEGQLDRDWDPKLISEATTGELNHAVLELLRRRRQVSAIFTRALALVGPDLQEKAARSEMKKILVEKCRFTDSDCGANPGKSSANWMPDASAARKAWREADGFANMRHRCTFVGDEAECSIWPDPLHQYMLRLFATHFTPLLLTGKMLDKHINYGDGHLASVKEAFQAVGLSLSDRGGQLHLAQLHGNRIKLALSVVLNHIFPQPYRGAIAEIEVVLPFLLRASNEIEALERQYGCGTDPLDMQGGCCSDLTVKFARLVEMLDVYNSNMIPPLNVWKGGKKTERIWSWCTSPSVYIFTVHSPVLFAERYPTVGGLAGRSTAAPEMAHKVSAAPIAALAR